jgi:methionine biosynthesis protein MetW
MSESYLFPFLGFVPDPCRYEKSCVIHGDSYDIISSLIRNGSRVLEIGCGTGSLIKYLAMNFDCIVEGVEPNKERADVAKQKGLSVTQAYITPDIELCETRFDYIIIADVLEHLSDPSLLLLQTRKFLSKEGFYIISVPNMIHWSVRLKVLSGNFKYTQYGLLDATHLRWFTEHSIKAYMGYLNFDVLKVRHTNGLSLPCYTSLPFFSRFSEKVRAKILNRLTRLFPGLFACQIVIMAQPKSDLLVEPSRQSPESYSIFFECNMQSNG